MKKLHIKRFAQLIVIVAFILLAAILMFLLNKSKPIAKTKEAEKTVPLVEYQQVNKASIEINVPSQGLVQPKKRTQLASEISGKVIWMNEKFVVGGQFNTDEEILRIETAALQTVLTQAESQLIEAQVRLTNEQALAAQARRDWQRLGTGQPTELALRIPQIKNAEARITAAKASIEKAKLDLTKTVIRAPFPATVARKNTEIGNFLAPGSPIGEFFQTTPLEVRLPIPLDEIPFLDTGSGGEILGKLTLSTQLANDTLLWDATITRTEGQIDQSSRSMFVISDIDPKAKSNNPLQLQPGLFLDATISGKTFEDIAIVPANAFLDLDTVVVINKQDQLEFRPVKVLRREDNFVYVSQGLNENDRICITELATMIEGTTVKARLAKNQSGRNRLNNEL